MLTILTIYLIILLCFLSGTALFICFKSIKHPILIMFVILIAIASSSSALYITVINLTSLADVTVPDFSGKTVEQAQKTAAPLNLKLKVSQKIYGIGIPEHQIIAQHPEAGRIVKTGRTINLTVSIGKRKIFVPNLVGKDFSQINVVLREAGLTLGEIRKVASVEFPTNTVMAQFPPAEEAVVTGSIVNITICINPEETTAEAKNKEEHE